MYFVRMLRIRAPAIHSAVPQDVNAGQERASAKEELMRQLDTGRTAINS
jgi:hypothetical protein